MKLITFFLIAIFSTSVVYGSFKHQKSKKWKQHAKKFSLNHLNDNEQEKIFENFDKTDQLIEKHNADPNASFKMEHNQFSHLSFQEKKKFSGLKIDNSTHHKGNLIQRTFGYNAPAEIDLIKSGWNTPVKTQECNDCWAFSTSTATEYYLWKKGQSVVLSPQELVDCTKSLGNRGCDPSYPHLALTYIQSSKLNTESNYPYGHGSEGSCKSNRGGTKYGIQGWSWVQQNSDSALMEALNKYGAIVVGVDCDNLFNYKTGIFDQCKSQPNHAVVLVGYGEKNGKKYWKIKNSWGPTWGENGYGYISRDKPNTCGITTMGLAITN